ncbi:MAG: hypothetical protein LC754_19045 [Acidobacteria bacterium]|nr:hypothetical protein [Acidobacteriota bacterium]
MMLILQGVAFGSLSTASAQRKAKTATQPQAAPPAPPMINKGNGGAVVLPTVSPVMVFAPVNVRQAARQEKLAPAQPAPAEIRSIDAPRGDRPAHRTVPIMTSGGHDGRGRHGARCDGDERPDANSEQERRRAFARHAQ